MISQADIIRTLVNKNCTDESVMSTALSPDCTLPKLLEKLTEAERFDLALDVSMKLGLDAIPLWRIWAMRCLQNRNFQGAREKFRHCFLKLRSPGGRANPMKSKLLNDILEELTKIDETQLPLIEEIEQIKQRKYPSDCDVALGPPPSIFAKPTLIAECFYYLKEYGDIEDRIKFYIRNGLWEEAVHVLLTKSDQINVDKFFLTDVVFYLNSIGRLSELITAFLKSDPHVSLSAKYFKSLYNFCSHDRRYHLLYYIQTTIGDHIAAARTQIDFFFLRKPLKNYKELAHRIGNLSKACQNYQEHLNKMMNDAKKAPPMRRGERGNPSANLANNSVRESLLTRMSKSEVEKHLLTIKYQIDITRNFSINEVSGCINGVEIGVPHNDDSAKQAAAETERKADDTPVTLFDDCERRKTFLVALVLIYFDLSCSAYFSKSGLDLANQLINDHGLDKMKVFKTAMRIIIEDESCDLMENASLLLDRIREDHLASKKFASDSHERKPRATERMSRSHSTTSSVMSSSSMLGDETHTAELTTTSTLRERQPSALSAADEAQALCDEVIRDSIGSCREADYKMELAKLLSGEAKIELYIEHGKLSNAQRLACNMNRPDYVSSIIEEAVRLNQDHVKTVCQLWLAKHETRNFLRNS